MIRIVGETSFLQYRLGGLPLWFEMVHIDFELLLNGSFVVIRRNFVHQQIIGNLKLFYNNNFLHTFIFSRVNSFSVSNIDFKFSILTIQVVGSDLKLYNKSIRTLTFLQNISSVGEKMAELCILYGNGNGFNHCFQFFSLLTNDVMKLFMVTCGCLVSLLLFGLYPIHRIFMMPMISQNIWIKFGLNMRYWSESSFYFILYLRDKS